MRTLEEAGHTSEFRGVGENLQAESQAVREKLVEEGSGLGDSVANLWHGERGKGRR